MKFIKKFDYIYLQSKLNKGINNLKKHYQSNLNK